MRLNLSSKRVRTHFILTLPVADTVMYTQIVSQCPAMISHEQELDAILSRSFIEAKYYRKKVSILVKIKV